MAGRKATNEIGNCYGRLTVIQRSESGTNGLAKWLCSCDCGKEIFVNGRDLRRGSTRSCGCLRDSLFVDNQKMGCKAIRRKTLPLGEAAFRRALRNMEKTAKRRGVRWELTNEDAKSLMNASCHYCGSQPKNICKGVADNGNCYYSGIDRKDSSIGYILSNVVPCCFTCNRAKGALTEREFLLWIDSIVAFRAKKGDPSIPVVV